VNFWRPIKNVNDLPQIGSRESASLDFKEQGYGKNESESCEAARDVAQFANHLGGTIILGAKENKGSLKEYVDVVDIEDHRTRIRDICAARIEPSVSIEPVEIDCGGKKVLAINVSPSIFIVGVRISTNRYEFPIRRNDRKDFLTLQEVAMMGTPERRGLLLLESIPQVSRGKLRIDAEEIPVRFDQLKWQLEDIGKGYAKFQVDNLTVYVPLAFVEAVWPSDSYGEYTITIKARFRIVENGLKVEVSRARTW